MHRLFKSYFSYPFSLVDTETRVSLVFKVRYLGSHLSGYPLKLSCLIQGAKPLVFGVKRLGIFQSLNFLLVVGQHAEDGGIYGEILCQAFLAALVWSPHLLKMSNHHSAILWVF